MSIFPEPIKDPGQLSVVLTPAEYAALPPGNITGPCDPKKSLWRAWGPKSNCMVYCDRSSGKVLVSIILLKPHWWSTPRPITER